MFVFVETNFVLELVLSRDNFSSCRELITLAEDGQLQLLVPAYSFVEPHEAVIRRRKSRLQVHDAISREIKDITRSIPFEAEATQLNELTKLLIDVGEREQEKLQEVKAELLKTASTIDLSAEILHRAIQLQDDLSLSPQDSVVFASVLAHLDKHGGPACFITTNSKDFSAPEIEDYLQPYGCKILFNFQSGLEYVRHQLRVQRPAE